MRQILSIALILLAGFAPLNAQFAANANHPELTWEVLETEHFKIYYHQGLADFAARTAPGTGGSGRSTEWLVDVTVFIPVK